MNRGLVIVVVVAVTSVLAAATASGGGVAPARTDLGPTGEPGAIVSMGDSYISGEAARWMGNSTSEFGDRAGTDRAHRSVFGFDVESVYVDGTYESGCHRARPAPIDRAYLWADAFNIACSGARTINVSSSSAGGIGYRGEEPQADQLAEIAADNAVELVVVSIGGNDLGFTDMIIDCTVAYTSSFLWWRNRCAADEQAEVDRDIDATMDRVVDVLNDIRAVLTAHGDGSARVVLMSYPSPVPRGEAIRYDTNFSRVFVGGCPFWRSDATWARDSLVPQIASELRAAARAAQVEFLDVQDLFEGRELCAEGVGHSDGSPTDVTDEWVRFVRTGLLQGDAGESLHPNYFGQRAIGRCIGLLGRAEPGGEWTCTNRPGRSASQLDLTPL